MIIIFKISCHWNYILKYLLMSGVLLRRGIMMQNHENKHKIKASMTAALPKSFARCERSCFSNEIRSIAASTPEFRSSTIKTKRTEPNKIMCSTGETGKIKLMGIKIAARVNSWRKALSSRTANTNPFQELTAALKALVIPLLPLWGFWSMEYFSLIALNFNLSTVLY